MVEGRVCDDVSDPIEEGKQIVRIINSASILGYVLQKGFDRTEKLVDEDFLKRVHRNVAQIADPIRSVWESASQNPECDFKQK
ncbi:hypothetical protein BLNAU_23134 [Blattamonas nauphoetae]|uniref:Uncharacterized protein n=1 Tax=Blattamonas nauphoetae TaxID=2049346 RepID=A0ABQ9WTA6_9EUKA|nr:hypothetical protein BLNAU_23134 [Blattamonas nauphoetae]